MGFWDRPIVDKISERSEDSVLKTQLIFSRRNGFNSHPIEGSKDYGIDISCELLDNNRALGNSFPIQIKSVKKIRYVYKDKKKYYTLQFLTSRLGYLCNQVPTYGVIVLYIEDTDTLYFDYVTEIYNRIRLEKKDESWKDKNTVTIKIPEENILKDNIENIHNTFINRFANLSSLIDKHGGEFDIPSFNQRKYFEEPKENNEITQAINFLENLGPYLFNQREYPKIASLLDLLPKKDLNRTKIAYIAALTYAEVGEFIDADYFLKVCYSKKDDYTSEEFLSLEMQRFKVDFAYGLKDKNEFINQLKQLRKRETNNDNILNIDINIKALELSEKIGKLTNNDNILIEIENIFKEIENITKSKEQKHFQKIFLSENLIHVLTSLYSDYLNDKKLLGNFQISNSNRWHEKEIKRILNSFSRVINNINNSFEYANSENHKLMKAHALHKLAVAYFSINLPSFINNENPSIENAKKILKTSLDYTINAYNLFIEINVFHQAYLAITLAYDIYRLSEEWLNYKLDNITSLSDIKNQIQNFSNYTFYRQFNSVIDEMSNETIKKTSLKHLDDDDLDRLADKIIKVNDLPIQRKLNLLNELKSYRYFENNCTNKDLILLTNQTAIGDLAYSTQTKYEIKSSTTNIVYSRGYDIQEMLRDIEG